MANVEGRFTVDPMVSFERSLNNIGAERSCRIKTTAGIKDPYFKTSLVRQPRL